MKKNQMGKELSRVPQSPHSTAALTFLFLTKACAPKKRPMIVAHLMEVSVKGYLKMYLPLRYYNLVSCSSFSCWLVLGLSDIIECGTWCETTNIIGVTISIQLLGINE